MRRIAKPVTNLDDMITKAVAKETDPSLVSDISIDKLIDDGLIALNREITNLKTTSAHGKLDAADARDLRDHLKLLFELKDRESDSLKGLTDEELEAFARDILSKLEKKRADSAK